jgi:hypothetical protein
MTCSDEAREVVVTDVAARERPLGVLSSRFSRVRCVHCAMPARGGEPTCWSCGLDPAHPVDEAAQQPSGALHDPQARQGPRWVTFGICGLAVLLVVLLVSALVITPGDDAKGLRGLADRVRGGTWERAGLHGAAAEFPVRPVRVLVATGSDRADLAEGLIATTPEMRVELWALTGGADGSGEDLLDELAAAAGKRIDTTGAAVQGFSTLDALGVAGAERTTRVRTTVAGSSAYLLAVTGPAEAFDRFTSSFELGS